MDRKENKPPVKFETDEPQVRFSSGYVMLGILEGISIGFIIIILFQ